MRGFPKSLGAAAVLGTAAVLGNIYGVSAFMLTLAAGVLLVVILILWASVQSLTGDAPLTFEEALSLGAATPEEERKRAVIRTLKDLEYERTVGKISEDDFQALSAQYRAEARQLLRSLDDDLAPARQEAETLLKERLAAADTKQRTHTKDGGGVEGDDAEGGNSRGTEEPEEPSSYAETASPAARACAKCDTQNDADATFCKHCGEKLAAPSTAEPSVEDPA